MPSGKDICRGIGKRIIWSPLKEHVELVGDAFVFRVIGEEMRPNIVFRALRTFAAAPLEAGKFLFGVHPVRHTYNPLRADVRCSQLTSKYRMNPSFGVADTVESKNYLVSYHVSGCLKGMKNPFELDVQIPEGILPVPVGEGKSTRKLPKILIVIPDKFLVNEHTHSLFLGWLSHGVTIRAGTLGNIVQPYVHAEGTPGLVVYRNTTIAGDEEKSAKRLGVGYHCSYAVGLNIQVPYVGLYVEYAYTYMPQIYAGKWWYDIEENGQKETVRTNDIILKYEDPQIEFDNPSVLVGVSIGFDIK